MILISLCFVKPGVSSRSDPTRTGLLGASLLQRGNGNPWVPAALIEAAHGPARSKGTFLGELLRRLSKHLGVKGEENTPGYAFCNTTSTSAKTEFLCKRRYT
jgi:hypothetical protein